MKLIGGQTENSHNRKILETDRFALWAETGPHNIIAGFIILNKQTKEKQVVLVLDNFSKAWNDVGRKLKQLI